METDTIAEVHVANRNNKWEVFFPAYQDAMFSTDTADVATAWANTLAGESGYKVIVQG